MNLNKLVGSLVAAVAIGATAQLSISLGEDTAIAPVTGQSLAVTLAAFLLGRNWGVVTILIYLLLGGLGLPVFADFEGGIAVITGPSLGYFIGFVLAAAFIGWWAETKENKFGRNFLAFTLGTLLILAAGLIGLLPYLDIKQAFMKGVLPFLPGALIKILLATILISVISRFQALMNRDDLRQK